MSPLVPLTMYGWPLIVVLLFGILEPRRAVTWSFAVGWCFLPVAEFPVSGLPDYTKTSATAYGILIGTAIFHLGSALTWRPSLLDIPAAVWCVCPLFSSLANGLGLFDGQSAMLEQTMTWGIPYLIGRIHFRKLSDLQDFVAPVVGCALLYVPLCLFEIRMSPHLHATVYGFMQHSFFQTMRGDGWRPMVFMRHGLEVGMWMATATLLSVSRFVFARNRNFRLWGFEIPTWAIVLLLGTTFGLVKSTGAIVLGLAGFATLVAAKVLGTVLPTYVFPLGCVLYLLLRSIGLWDGDLLVRQAANLSEDRAASLQFRLDNEDILCAKALERPTFGWGGWGRARVYDEEGKDISVTDGAWIVALGNQGLVGLCSLYATMLLGPTMLLWLCPPNRWKESSATVSAASIAVVCLMAAGDSLPNDHQIPLMTMALGICVSVSLGEQAVEAIGDAEPVPPAPGQ